MTAGEPAPHAVLPAWQVSHWFNTQEPIELAQFRGRVVLVHAFQMLCPACVVHGLPQARRVHEAFGREQVAVIGLHTVFEHHDAMGPTALRAFIHEYRLPFPIGVDQASAVGDVPVTMAQWDLRGTPSALLIDRQGRLRLHRFGVVEDLELGAAIGQLLAEGWEADPSGATPPRCDDTACLSA